MDRQLFFFLTIEIVAKTSLEKRRKNLFANEFDILNTHLTVSRSNIFILVQSSLKDVIYRRNKSENKRRICLVFFVVSPFHPLELQSTPALDCFLFNGGHHIYFPLNQDEDYMLQGMPINQIKRKEKGVFLIVLLFRQTKRKGKGLLASCLHRVWGTAKDLS